MYPLKPAYFRSNNSTEPGLSNEYTHQALGLYLMIFCNIFVIVGIDVKSKKLLLPWLFYHGIGKDKSLNQFKIAMLILGLFCLLCLSIHKIFFTVSQFTECLLIFLFIIITSCSLVLINMVRINLSLEESSAGENSHENEQRVELIDTDNTDI
jgi:hypothetical protein